MAESSTEWACPVYHALAAEQVFLIGGIPQVPFICIWLITVGLVLLQWRFLILGAALHGGLLVLTQWEMHWWTMWQRYRRYAAYYEG